MFSLLFEDLACFSLHIPLKLEAYSPYSVSSKQWMIFFHQIELQCKDTTNQTLLSSFYKLLTTFLTKTMYQMLEI